jgi:ribonuclease Y
MSPFVLTGIIVTLMLMVGYYFALVRPETKRAQLLRDQASSIEAHLRKDAELKAETLILEAKRVAIELRERAEAEVKEKLALVAKSEDRICARDEALDLRRSHLDEREENLLKDQRMIVEREEQIERRLKAAAEELQRVAALTQEQAREIYLDRIEDQFHEIGLRKAKEIESQTVAEAEKKAKKVLLDIMQRSVVDYVTEATLAVVELPSEDMKGRIIGREGRNIRAFEQVTGVDLIIDETPEAVVISCFDPVRREIARLTLMNLMVDGRIHPGRIEELHEKAQAEVARMILDAGEKAAERANVPGLPPKIIETMGRLRFRTSYAQNVLDHSVEVARLSESLAAEMGLNAEVAKRAGLLHDIGKALGPEYEGPHALAGMEFLRAMGERDAVLLAVGAHHHEIEPTSGESIVVILSDTISAARPGARRENLENYVKRLAALETLANSFPGVERSYAVQAGREIRLIVKPSEVSDIAAATLAHEVAKRIERELEFPGQIKVTVIRELRVQEIAK